MTESRSPMPDEQREVHIDDTAELELPPPTLDHDERIEVDVDVNETVERSRSEAMETGQIIPDNIN